MTLTDQIKILANKFKANQAQYDLSREAAKIYALSSKDLLEKYEYLTGEKLGHNPSVFEKAKFEYSPLGMSLTEALKNMRLKALLRARVISIMIATTPFLIFTKGLINLKTCHSALSTI